jgi:hypothetical protein
LYYPISRKITHKIWGLSNNHFGSSGVIDTAGAEIGDLIVEYLGDLIVEYLGEFEAICKKALTR